MKNLQNILSRNLKLAVAVGGLAIGSGCVSNYQPVSREPIYTQLPDGRILVETPRENSGKTFAETLVKTATFPTIINLFY